MAETQKQPSVIRFEQEVAAKNYEAACVELLDILNKIDTNFGGIEGIEIDYPSQLNDELVQERKEKAVTYEKLQDKEIELKEQIKRLNDKEYIEKLARSEYFLSNDGEIIFKLPEDKKDAENDK